MSRQSATTTILFADICRSTQLFELYGDVRARQIEAQVLALLAEKVKKHDGEVIKTIGDEIMCSFTGPERAIFSASEMQRAVTRVESLAPLDIAIRIGLHCGKVILEDNDVFGDAVNTAARMASLAKAGQIITTQTTVDLLPAIMHRTIRNLGLAKVRGKKAQLAICEVIWQEDTSDLTSQFQVDGQEAPVKSLTLTYGERLFEINVENQPFLLGRNPRSDLTIDAKFASRNHAYIELSQGKFILTDSSTNGTYIRIRDGRRIFLRRESFPLYGEGLISLGRDSDDSEFIHYRFSE
ncbi:MAG: adenylate/guanylate cyclase domain-containing protein [Candidatus Competibacteraceae bacterium]|jgi:class 3 adenylate cyclase|nr:adenylate/guanylate cyclase domain-containing protein [Candidatus Competibacteraceae bacterium]